MNVSQVKKPVIAVFLNAFWVAGQGMSGGDQMAIQIFRRLRNNFSTLVWFSNPDGKRMAQLEISDANYSTTPAWLDRLPIGLSYLFRTIVATIRLLSTRSDIVYSGSDFFPDVLPAWIYRKFNSRVRWVQCVFHIYPDWRTRPGNKWVNFLAATFQQFSLKLAKQADGIVNINHEVKRYLIQHGFDHDRIAVITPGVDIKQIDAVLSDQSSIERYDAIFLGRLNPSKGIFDLPDIWKRVVGALPNARLALIGGGGDEIRKTLMSAFSTAGVEDNVHLLGFVESDCIYAMLKNARAFVFPSHEEGFGIAIVEAMACGLPVVAWNLPVFQELFEDAICTVPQGDNAAFASMVIAVLEANGDAVQKARAVYCAKKYSWDEVSERMQAWFDDMLTHAADSMGEKI